MSDRVAFEHLKSIDGGFIGVAPDGECIREYWTDDLNIHQRFDSGGQGFFPE